MSLYVKLGTGLFLLYFCFSNPGFGQENGQNLTPVSTKVTIAVAEFIGRNVSDMDAAAISDFVRTALVHSELFDVVDRGNMTKIIEEQKFQTLGCTNTECAIAMGRLLGVKKMVVGTLTKISRILSISADVVDVESGRIICSERVKCNNEDNLIDQAEYLGKILARKIAEKENLPVPESLIREIEKPIEIAELTEEMVLIPAGEFVMGLDTENIDDTTIHRVYLDAFYIDKYEVTNEQYARFLNSYGKDVDDQGYAMINEQLWGLIRTEGQWKPVHGYEKNPVLNVTWYGANQYAKWAGKRLPTEAEWEKAARGIDGRIFPWGNKWDRDRLNSASTWADRDLAIYEDWYKYFLKDTRTNSLKKATTVPVGSYPAGVSPYGVYDMAGNVWEWCNDWYDAKYYRDSPYKNPTGAKEGMFRVIRGGAWNSLSSNCRVIQRVEGYTAHHRNCLIGFRCAK